MTNYEVFKAATPEKLAMLLTSLVCGLLQVDDPEEIYHDMLEMLDQEVVTYAN